MEKKFINGQVYKEIDFEEVVSSHNDKGDILYHIFYGDVDWHRDGNLQKALCIFMKYNNKISFQTPANVLLTDLLIVEEAISRLKARNMEFK
ncbi:hypothetical protein [Clostridium beijerinckii]|uniref:Uncharacterized protein n=1 Tax=Clostridium beijerinckii TaxID=1520 RepID=A0AAX0B6T8_CLOBE|nr:hypothetical protein [Clostridium beijerinckii]NRT90889.1 hypothetical protein [Clostridium beijerinckii]NYC70415.1 hypothetical protein [Clostridium beijerinckii]